MKGFNVTKSISNSWLPTSERPSFFNTRLISLTKCIQIIETSQILFHDQSISRNFFNESVDRLSIQVPMNKIYLIIRKFLPEFQEMS